MGVNVCRVLSEEEAKKKIYSVCTTTYTGFGALISEELSLKVKGTISWFKALFLWVYLCCFLFELAFLYVYSCFDVLL